MMAMRFTAKYSAGRCAYAGRATSYKFIRIIELYGVCEKRRLYLKLLIFR